MADEGADPRDGVIEGEILNAGEGDFGVPAPLDMTVIAGMTRAEIDVQIATAHKFPRSITKAQRLIETLATLDVETATSCRFQKPQRERKRDPKTGRWEWVDGFLEGPSIRFAEIVMQAWGNGRVASRVTDQTETEIEATGVFHDLESNVAWAKSVRVSILTREGKKVPAHLITTLGNAAAAKAIRNAIYAGVPRGIWNRGYQAALAAARGDAKTLPDRRKGMFAKALEEGITAEQVYAMLNVQGEADITIDHLFQMAAFLTAIHDGETTVDEVIARHHPAVDERGLSEAFGGRGKENGEKPAPAQRPREPAPRKDAPAQQKAPEPQQPAPTVEQPKDTKDSATAASGGSPAETSGPQQPAEPSHGGEKEAEKPSAEVVNLSDHKAPTTIDEIRARQTDNDRLIEQTRGLPATPSAEIDPAQDPNVQSGAQDDPAPPIDTEAFNAFARDVGQVGNWGALKPIVADFRCSGAFKNADAELQKQALKLAWDTCALWPFPEGDVDFFRLWVATTAQPSEVRLAFRRLMRGAEYQNLDPETRDLIVDETNAAAGDL